MSLALNITTLLSVHRVSLFFMVCSGRVIIILLLMLCYVCLIHSMEWCAVSSSLLLLSLLWTFFLVDEFVVVFAIVIAVVVRYRCCCFCCCWWWRFCCYCCCWFLSFRSFLLLLCCCCWIRHQQPYRRRLPSAKAIPRFLPRIFPQRRPVPSARSPSRYVSLALCPALRYALLCRRRVTLPVLFASERVIPNLRRIKNPSRAFTVAGLRFVSKSFVRDNESQPQSVSKSVFSRYCTAILQPLPPSLVKDTVISKPTQELCRCITTFETYQVMSPLVPSCVILLRVFAAYVVEVAT